MSKKSQPGFPILSKVKQRIMLAQGAYPHVLRRAQQVNELKLLTKLWYGDAFSSYNWDKWVPASICFAGRKRCTK